jgi:hypothetical protein
MVSIILITMCFNNGATTPWDRKCSSYGTGVCKLPKDFAGRTNAIIVAAEWELWRSSCNNSGELWRLFKPLVLRVLLDNHLHSYHYSQIGLLFTYFVLYGCNTLWINFFYIAPCGQMHVLCMKVCWMSTTVTLLFTKESHHREVVHFTYTIDFYEYKIL